MPPPRVLFGIRVRRNNLHLLIYNSTRLLFSISLVAIWSYGWSWGLFSAVTSRSHYLASGTIVTTTAVLPSKLLLLSYLSLSLLPMISSIFLHPGKWQRSNAQNPRKVDTAARKDGHLRVSQSSRVIRTKWQCTFPFSRRRAFCAG